MSNQVRIQELLEYVQQGRIMDAMREFYAEDVVMEEPMYGTTPGLEANLEREQKFVDSVKEFRGFEAKNVSVGENCDGSPQMTCVRSECDGPSCEIHF